MNIDPIIHSLPRFKICATLSAFQAAEGDVNREMRFSALREHTGLKDAALSKHLSALEVAGYIRRFREYGATRVKDTVWVSLTEKGKLAFDGHLAALRAMADPQQYDGDDG